MDFLATCDTTCGQGQPPTIRLIDGVSAPPSDSWTGSVPHHHAANKPERQELEKGKVMPTSCRIVTQANLFHPAGCCELLGGHWAPGGSDMSRVIQLLGGRSHSVWSELRAHAVLTWLYSAGFSAAFPKAIQRSSFWV